MKWILKTFSNPKYFLIPVIPLDLILCHTERRGPARPYLVFLVGKRHFLKVIT